MLVSKNNSGITERQLIDCYRKVAIFSGLDNQVLDKVVNISNIKHLRKGQFLYVPGESLDFYHIVLQGRIKLSKSTSHGRLVTIRIRNPGDSFGNTLIFTNDPLEIAVQALDTVILSSIAKSDFMELCNSHHELLIAMIHQMSKQIRKLGDTILEFATLSATERLAKVICNLSQVSNEIPITHHEIADLAGTTRETATKIIMQFSQEGIINVSRGKLTVLDKSGLKIIGR
ncbi:Crp/Fnr family transcriptional regulator [Chloroflexota bacterium]